MLIRFKRQFFLLAPYIFWNETSIWSRLYVHWSVGWSVCHIFFKGQMFHFHIPIGALVNSSTFYVKICLFLRYIISHILRFIISHFLRYIISHFLRYIICHLIGRKSVAQSFISFRNPDGQPDVAMFRLPKIFFIHGKRIQPEENQCHILFWVI